MSKSRYLLMSKSNQVDINGNKRIDIFSFPINEFRQNDVLLDWTLSESDVLRFDQLIINFYGSVDFNIEIVKWLNNLFEMDESKIGTKIKLPSKRDISRFLRDNLVSLERG